MVIFNESVYKMKKNILISISLLFGFISLFFSSDFLSYYVKYVELMKINNTISYQISKKGIVDNEFKEFYLNKYEITIYADKTIYTMGEICEYQLIKKTHNFIKAFIPEYIKIESRCVVGIFNY